MTIIKLLLLLLLLLLSGILNYKRTAKTARRLIDLGLDDK